MLRSAAEMFCCSTHGADARESNAPAQKLAACMTEGIGDGRGPPARESAAAAAGVDDTDGTVRERRSASASFQPVVTKEKGSTNAAPEPEDDTMTLPPYGGA